MEKLPSDVLKEVDKLTNEYLATRSDEEKKMLEKEFEKIDEWVKVSKWI